MADRMEFPNTVEEFMEKYKIVDTEHVYTNGIEMVPIFRMKQWFDHVHNAVVRYCTWGDFEHIILELRESQLSVDRKMTALGSPVPRRGVDGRPMWFECSECQKPIDLEDTYCKHCGAKMT